MLLAHRHMNKRGQIARMVQFHMQFDRSFGRPKLCPVEKTQTQVNDRGIEAVERIFKPEFMLGCQR